MLSPDTRGRLLGGFFYGVMKINIFVYSDESGVFGNVHDDFFVFGGLVFLDKETKDEASRKYLHAERTIRNTNDYGRTELKACRITNKQKGKLYRALNQYYKFGVVVNQKNVLERIYKSKKDKQRFLDFVYKIAIKRFFEKLIRDKIISPNDVLNIYFFVDEHTTATNGRYELQESLEQEFKYGTYNWDYSKAFPPLFPNLRSVTVEFCNSEKRTLIRAADIVANNIYYHANSNNRLFIFDHNLHVITFP